MNQTTIQISHSKFPVSGPVLTARLARLGQRGALVGQGSFTSAAPAASVYEASWGRPESVSRLRSGTVWKGGSYGAAVGAAGGKPGQTCAVSCVGVSLDEANPAFWQQDAQFAGDSPVHGRSAAPNSLVMGGAAGGHEGGSVSGAGEDMMDAEYGNKATAPSIASTGWVGLLGVEDGLAQAPAGKKMGSRGRSTGVLIGMTANQVGDSKVCRYGSMNIIEYLEADNARQSYRK